MSKSLIVSTMPEKGKSKDTQWIAWYDLMKRNLPNQDAKTLWTKAWAKRGDATANTYNLRTAMDKEGIKVDGGVIGKATDAAGDTIKFGTGFIGNTLKITQYAGIAVLIIVVGGAGLLIYNIAKNPVAAARAGADLAGSVYTKGAVRVK